MHDSVKDSHWHEPKAGENAGFGAFKRPKLPYDRFMEDEGVPVYRGIGAARVQDLPMAPWKRLGGRGRAPSGAPSLREDRAGAGRPRLDGSLAGGSGEAPRLRMAERLALHDS